MPEIQHLSYSSLSAFNACARAWRFKYVDKVKVPAAANLVFGSAFHNTIEHYLTDKHSGQQADLPALWHESWQAVQEQEIAWNGATPQELADQGQNMITAKIDVEGVKFANLAAFLDTLSPKLNDNSDTLRMEERVTLTVPGLDVPVIGYIDMVSADGVPCDFKTAARIWEAGKADTELQPTFYLAALNQAGWAVFNFRYYVFTKAKTPKVQVIQTTRTASDMFWLLSALAETWQAIQAGVYPPTGVGSWKCTPEYCDYWKQCKA